MNIIENRWVTLYVDCQWLSVFLPAHYNWINFTFVELGIEYDKAGPQWDLEASLLGFTMRLSLGMPWETEMSATLKHRMDEMHENPGMAITFHPEAARELRNLGVKGIPPFPDPPSDADADVVKPKEDEGDDAS